MADPIEPLEGITAPKKKKMAALWEAAQALAVAPAPFSGFLLPLAVQENCLRILIRGNEGVHQAIKKNWQKEVEARRERNRDDIALAKKLAGQRFSLNSWGAKIVRL